MALGANTYIMLRSSLPTVSECMSKPYKLTIYIEHDAFFCKLTGQFGLTLSQECHYFVQHS